MGNPQDTIESVIEEITERASTEDADYAVLKAAAELIIEARQNTTKPPRRGS